MKHQEIQVVLYQASKNLDIWKFYSASTVHKNVETLFKV